MKNSDAKIKANNRYTEKTYDRLSIYIPKGQKEIIKSYADKQNKSLNGFIVDAIEKEIKKDIEDSN